MVNNWNAYEKVENYNPTKKKKVLIAFDYMIENMRPDKKLKPIFAGMFMRGRKLNLSVSFIWQSYFAVSKTIKLNKRHYFTMKISSKRKLQNNIKEFVWYRV